MCTSCNKDGCTCMCQPRGREEAHTHTHTTHHTHTSNRKDRLAGQYILTYLHTQERERNSVRCNCGPQPNRLVGVVPHWAPFHIGTALVQPTSSGPLRFVDYRASLAHCPLSLSLSLCHCEAPLCLHCSHHHLQSLFLSLSILALPFLPSFTPERAPTSSHSTAGFSPLPRCVSRLLQHVITSHSSLGTSALPAP
ncbi:hypothetical protein K431DRAFT_37923 [Polychaeton citri CBS 116435]|uniref:Uncharacterized protein n=1 Tax=Polychaeton citri CBS 116435 TaxID=1314669 RepID=A0A9P4UJP8_9PEZI|nr:hypothetical protein K431DRAFT_37923 [Polychaeton citri CBS 116435]